MTTTVTLNDAQITQLKTDTSNGTTNFQAGYADITSFISAATKAGTSIDAGTLVWYKLAPGINNSAVDTQAKYFIRDVTEYGERLDGHATGNTQAISDQIASNVIQTTINKGRILTLPELLGQDITGAINTFGMTIGGWGGAFYYWNEQPVLTNGTVQPSVGTQIEAALPAGLDFDGGGQYDKFIAANAAAAADQFNVLVAHPIQGLQALMNSISTGWNAETPFSIQGEIVGRALGILEGEAIVGSPDDIDGYLYHGGAWVSVTMGYSAMDMTVTLSEVSDPTFAGQLNNERGYREGQQGILGQTNSDLTSQYAQQNYDIKNVDTTVQFAEDGSCVQQTVETLSDRYYITDSTMAADGHEKAGVTVQLDTSGALVSQSDQLFDAQAHTLASEDFIAVAGSGSPSLSDVVFNAQSGDWTQVRMTFIAGTQDVSSISVKLADGSSESYMAGTGGNWSEEFTDTTGDLTKELEHGTFYDAAKGADVVGVQVTNVQANTTTVYADSDGNAPTYQLPGDAPIDYPSAASFWADAVSASNGTSSSAVAADVSKMSAIQSDTVANTIAPAHSTHQPASEAHSLRALNGPQSAPEVMANMHSPLIHAL